MKEKISKKNHTMQMLLSSLFFILVLTMVGLFYDTVVARNKIIVLEDQIAEQNQNISNLATWLREKNGILIPTSGQVGSQDALQIIRESDNGDKFLEYLNLAGITGILTNEEGSIIVYVPTDEALSEYESLFTDFINTGNTQSLNAILLNHIVSVTDSENTTAETGYRTASGNLIYPEETEVRSDLSEATIVDTNKNVVFIDSVLIPAL